MKLFRIIGFTLVIFTMISGAYAITPESRLPELQEQRARNLFLQVRCLVCDGQVIESSDSEIAKQMRLWIRDQIRQGKTDEQIKSNLVKNFGSDVINSADDNQIDLWLWLLPLAFFVILCISLFRRVKLKIL